MMIFLVIAPIPNKPGDATHFVRAPNRDALGTWLFENQVEWTKIEVHSHPDDEVMKTAALCTLNEEGDEIGS